MKKVIVSGVIILIALSSFKENRTTQPGIQQSIERGKKVYQSTCLACHQADGEGVPRMAPTLVKTKWVLGDKKALSKIVLNGLKGGEVEIDGDNFHNPMPAQASVLSDQQIADVLTYVRNSFGNKASFVSVAEVKSARGMGKTTATKIIKKTTR